MTKEVATAFERLKELRNHTSDNDLLSEHAEAFATRDWYDGLEPLNKVDLMTFAKMLIHGYEIEQTAEEQLAEFYKVKPFNEFGRGVRYGIKFALDALNLKIEGVNT